MLILCLIDCFNNRLLIDLGMTETSQKKANGFNWVRLVSDLGPALAFFIGYFIANKTHQANPILFATYIFLPVSVLAFAFSYWKEKKVSPIGLFSFAVIVIFSVLGIYLKNDLFIKMRPTFVYSVMGLILMGSVFLGRNVLKTLFDGAFHLPEAKWRRLSINAGIMYLALAVINELVWRNFAEKTWVTYNMWGDFAINMVFWIVSMTMLAKHMTDENGKPLMDENE